MATAQFKKTTSPESVTQGPASAPQNFAQNFFAGVSEEDLASYSRQEKSRIAGSLWAFGETRRAGEVKLRVYNPVREVDGWQIEHTVLEIINRDMPFLVDSTAGVLQTLGLNIHLIIHPVYHLRRDAKNKLVECGAPVRVGDKVPEGMKAESFMHIQFDHTADPKMLARIERSVREVLAYVRAAVDDWGAMRLHAHRLAETAATSPKRKHAELYTKEARDFLRWMDDNNFTYLGYRDIKFNWQGDKVEGIEIVKGSGLGVLRDDSLRVFGGLRDKYAEGNPALKKYVLDENVVIIAKSNLRTHVHRPVAMDAIFIRRFDNNGRLLGESLFVGLFTSQSYAQQPKDIPFIRHKIDYVLQVAGYAPTSHDGKALVHVLNNYPHDELFQISKENLFEHAMGIVRLQERRRATLFVRRDSFDRYVSCLVYVPRDRYNSAIRYKMQTLLEDAFQGKAEDWIVRLDEGMFARASVIIRTGGVVVQADLRLLEEQLRQICRSWTDDLRRVLTQQYGEAVALEQLRRYGKAFPPVYCEATTPEMAAHDIQRLQTAGAALATGILVDLTEVEEGGMLRLRLYREEQPIVLSNILPMLENAGLRVEYMGGPFSVTPADAAKPIYVHEFVAHPTWQPVLAIGDIKLAFEEGFARVWSGDAENDLFNALMLRAGLGWREVVALRVMGRYLRQLRIPYSQNMVAMGLVNYPQLTRKLVELFIIRHDPDFDGTREKMFAGKLAEMNDDLAAVTGLEDDRILRRYVNLIQASLRTNFFQTDAAGAFKPYVSIKFESGAVDFMPLPKPLYEIFVYSTKMEAVHLRGGKVARGGIRWSDRLGDFRNEILGLMKAQMVKNTVIVPVGSKGGFIVKNPSSDSETFRKEGVECYRTMMRGLLDLTDNYVKGKIVPPEQVVRHDRDDPYLVVAADKGTATFSDIANGISREYGFWLDDAFASGGSAGYDHKAMGITARGAWEAVKRHFRELGKDIQTTDFSCMGVGDMSGDVFGNGMLLSKHIRLVGAFDHRHIFCDPNPDAAISYAERERLFKLPRSSWADYDAKKISKGGGIFSRQEKSIKLTAEIKAIFGLQSDNVSPAELIQAMLKSEVELLYFGGIGTYVKASTESHEDVGDRTAEALRVDARDIRAAVIGEGANLGMTQRARIEYALKGGRLNTDAIDNSAGVDTSDHEVNIKILLRPVVDAKQLTLPARDKLLASMTDEVAKLVLRDNYRQTLILSLMEAEAVESLPQQVQAMQMLERIGLLNRAVEYLPDSEEIIRRQRAGRGLTRPEMAVLLAYTKIWLYQQLLDSDLPDDSAMRGRLLRYFPEALQKKYADRIRQHQLAREIVATQVTNSIVNRTGSYFVPMMVEKTGVRAADVMRAFVILRESCNLTGLWHEVQDLDNHVDAALQMEMLRVLRHVMTQRVYGILMQKDHLTTQMESTITSLRQALKDITLWLDKHTDKINGNVLEQTQRWQSAGVPAQLARRIALMPIVTATFDLLPLAESSGRPLTEVAAVYFALGQRLSIVTLMRASETAHSQTATEREAVRVVTDDIAAAQTILTGEVIGHKKTKSLKQGAEVLLQNWLNKHHDDLQRYDGLLNEARATGRYDLSVLTLAVRQLTDLRG